MNMVFLYCRSTSSVSNNKSTWLTEESKQFFHFLAILCDYSRFVSAGEFLQVRNFQADID